MFTLYSHKNQKHSIFQKTQKYPLISLLKNKGITSSLWKKKKIFSIFLEQKIKHRSLLK